MSALVYVLTSLSLLACVVAIVQACRRRAASCLRFFAVGWVLALLLFVANGIMAQAMPFGNMRHVLCFFPLVMFPACLYLRHYRQLDLQGYFTAASALMLVGALSMPLQAAWRQMPALQSHWFAPHVTSYVVAYGLITVAALLCVVSYCRADGSRDERAADAVLRLAFPFLTFGLCSGAIWADAAWGGYWAWDIKEVWSLITWGIILLYFHLAHAPALAGWRKPLLLLAFVVMMITFLVVNLLPALDSMHSYA